MREGDPFGGFLFRLTLGNIEIAGFSECTGLERETKVFEYAEGGVNSHSLKFPERGSVSNLVLKRGLTTSTELYEWCADVAEGSFRHANQRPSDNAAAGHSAASSSQDSSRRISVALLDASGEVRREWLLRRAFPVKWSGPELNATDSATAFESIEIAHEGIEAVEP